MGSPHGVQRPGLGHVLGTAEQRIAELAKRKVLAGPGTGAATLNDAEARIAWEVDCIYDGTPAAYKWPRHYVRYSSRLLSVVFSFDTAPTTASTFKVYKTGTALTPYAVGSGLSLSGTTITLASSTNFGVASFSDGYGADLDYLQVELVTVGTGAKDLNIQSRFG